MAIVKTNQDSLFPNIAPFWEDFLGKDVMGRSGWGNISGMPAVNISEQPHAFEVSLAAPGLQRDDFSIKVDGGVLTVSSSKEERQDMNEKSTKYTRREFSYRAFSRSFALPETVEEEKIAANYKDGILLIHLPKKVQGQHLPSRHIEVQ
mmetsp:Transcript_9510/g.21830  ORF Transcript_9510/g.21830 Transcript_9510/m.21830 type:complete len:149 (-) Transcript_9510:520-966(-)